MKFGPSSLPASVGEQLTSTGSQQRERSAMERVLQTIDHPNLVNLVGVILDAPMPNAIVLEYLPNGSVFDLLYTKQVQLPAPTRLKIANQLALAVCYLQASEPLVVHGDLKTPNLLLDVDLNVKLCDFSKARTLGDDRSANGSPASYGGSPRYMAPECFVFPAPASTTLEKVDIWGLGCCLVEILGGPIPYEELPTTAE